MNPHQKNKIDVNKLSAEEQRLFRLYGKLPNRKDLLQNKLKERKYFDSGDYALSKAGKASDVGVTTIGREHPVPENIPHATTPTAGQGVGIPLGITASQNGGPLQQATSHQSVAGHNHSPVKESRLQRETSVDDVDGGEEELKDELDEQK